MIELYSGLVEHVSAPPLAPVERPIDFEHLFRMTLGDHSLEREVLQLFDRQAGMLMERIAQSQSAPGIVAAAAHTMKGSARGIGAWQLARAADAVENAALSMRADLPKAVRALAVSVDEAKVAIADLLRAH
jgi:HPt (histidine-containing phosphotransfer) domain-containing protein